MPLWFLQLHLHRRCHLDHQYRGPTTQSILIIRKTLIEDESKRSVASTALQETFLRLKCDDVSEAQETKGFRWLT